MTDADSPDFTLAWHLAQFVPINKWFEPYEAKVVVVQVFRVYLDRFARRPRFPSAFLIEDFESLRVRAAFTRTNMLFPDIEIARQLFPTSEGGTEARPEEAWVVLEGEEYMKRTDREIWRSTQEGTFLFLMTPSLSEFPPDGTPTEIPHEVVETLTLARAAVMVTMGRNAAFEKVLESQLVLGDEQSTIGSLTRGRDEPTNHKPPNLSGEASQLAKHFVETYQELEKRTRNRVSLALRWYIRAQRHPAPDEELRTDTFISYWIAFEALAMPNEKARSAHEKLAMIHDVSVGRSQEIFPIGRLQGLRSKILHYGEVYPLDNDLLRLMDNLVLDVLMYVLDISHTPLTAIYSDGSANHLLPDMNWR